jgi:GT2 family glycosyltransferase
MRHHKKKNSRQDLQSKIQKAMDKKPTADHLNSKGYTPEEIENKFGHVSAIARRRLKGSNKGKLKRVSTSPRSSFARSSLNVPPQYKEMSPNWFVSNGKVDVSIIVPLFKSSKEITEQIENWDLKDDGLTKEIIYVDDQCPQKSYEKVIEAWNEKMPSWNKKIGRIILHDRNAGFAHACNTGSKYASGKYLIFLNADIVVSENWIAPMIELMEKDQNIGIVGNLIIKKNTNYVESAGSEWNGKHFAHIGKEIFQGKRLGTPMTIQEMPSELKIPEERQMVTGACFAIKKQVFDYIQGFDTEYKIGYWEDSDLNMKVKMAGYKIYYQPDSMVYHQVGHSQVGHNQFVEQNKQKFYQDWVNTQAMNLINQEKNINLKDSKIVVYTAISKGYDSIIQNQNPKGADFIAFLEDQPSSGIWQLRPFENRFQDSNRNAKIYKILSHEYFPEYEYSLWIDGNVRLIIPVDILIQTFLKDADMALFNHPERNCIYKEAETCKKRNLDNPDVITNQINHYKKEGYPANAGLAECTVILRRHTEKIKEFNNAWWEEIQKWSRRDQLSFPVVAKKIGIKYNYFPSSLRTNNSMFLKLHNHSKRYIR